MTEVVTSILENNSEILLLKRSQNVRTYPGCWSGVSGYLEGNEPPIDRAYQEILEELGLQDSQLDFLRTAEPIKFTDRIEEIEQEWIVHPFLFHSHSRIINLDWENIEYAWISPSSVKSLKTVPKLLDVLRGLDVR